MEKVNLLLTKLSNLLGYIAIVFLVFLVVGTTADVILRNFFDISITGIFEVSELSMVLVVCLGLGWTFIDNGHISVTLLIDKMSTRHKAAVNMLTGLVVVVFLFCLAYPSTIEAIRSTSIREFRWGVVEVPIWWSKVVLSGCLWFTCLQFLIGTINSALSFFSGNLQKEA